MTSDRNELMKIRDLVFKESGIKISSNKESFIRHRVMKRMKELEIVTIRDYYRHIKYRDPNKKEFLELVNSFTTNETYFFRDYNQLEVFANYNLDEAAEIKRKINNKVLRIWSAACSTGEEPYTIAIILAACLDDFDEWDIKILATDIDQKVLSTAREGIYRGRSLKYVADEYMDSFFEKTEEGFVVKPHIRSMINFKKLNLTDAESIAQYKDNFDFIFCRNVLIYFEEAMRREIIENLYNALVENGFIYLGEAETVSRLSERFVPRNFEGSIVFQKPTAANTGTEG